MKQHSVLVVEDSRMMRNTVAKALARIRGIGEVYEAADGHEALRVAREKKPDLISLDLGLPGLHGIDVLREIMKDGGSKVIVVSAMTTKAADITMECLSLGAVDFVSKPRADRSPQLFEMDLRRTFRAAMEVGREAAAPVVRTARSKVQSSPDMIMIASSTGGPKALHTFFESITVAPKAPMVIVQHMPKGFTASMANRLGRLGPVAVREAEDNAPLEAGHALVCAGDRHMTITAKNAVYNDDPPVVGLRPRADITLTSAAQVFGSRVLTIVFTGMGKDGLEGGRAVVQAGGHLWAQDAKSSLVDGMPRAVRSAGLAEYEGTPEELAAHLSELYSSRSSLASK